MRKFLPLFCFLALLGGSIPITAAPKRPKPSRKPPAPQTMDVAAIEKTYLQADALFDQGKYPQAKARMAEAYASFGLLENKDSETLVRYLRLLCDIAVEMNELSRTLAYAKALSTHAVDENDKAFAFASMGRAYQNNGDYGKAIELYEKGLRIERQILGPEHSDVAISYLDIGGSLASKGEYDKAIGYFQKSLAVDLKTVEPDDPDLAYTYSSLGSAYDLKKDYGRAIAYYKKALAIELKALGPLHRNLAYTYSNLGSAHGLKGDHHQSIACFQKALTIATKNWGSKHPFKREVSRNLANAKRKAGITYGTSHLP
jgi:tetratricopeptide (TPR) repeat protein